MAAKTVDAYIASLPPEQAEVVSTIRQIIRKTAPKAAEAVKWAQPVYEENGPFCYIKAFKSHVTFGFWRGIDLPGERRPDEARDEVSRSSSPVFQSVPRC